MPNSAGRLTRSASRHSHFLFVRAMEREKTSWVKCILFGSKAEKLPQYLTKGTKVTVTGEFVMEEWTDQNGGKRSQPVIIVMDIDFGSSGNKQAAQQQSEPDFDSTIPF
ncbi:single-stranded DNA-binding protein [Enterobacter cloacae]|uniref:single-stranded DNA-binding protein n=1 Tax=Enterobacter cloacae TaxID=550 RepID=UPI0022CDFE4C|nr:single-stranded DNA-binding protein [Enterobacter cloacae]